MRHARLLIYEGPEQWIDLTLQRSLQEGQNAIGSERFITVIPLDTTKFDEENAVAEERYMSGSKERFEDVDA